MQVRQTSKMALAVIAGSMILAPAAQAFEFKTSGQISRMVVLPDDAVGDEIQHQDIGFSGSRFRFTGSETMDNGMEVGFRYEIQARQGQPTAGENASELSSVADQENRLQDIYFKGGFGSIAMGRGDGAGNGTTEVDLSGTVLASPSTLQSNWGRYAITAGGQEWSTVYSLQDALSRQNRVRYDSPNLNGLSLAASINQGNANEVAVRYKGSFGSSKFVGAFFTATRLDTATNVSGDDVTGGSASLLLQSGLNFTVAISDRDTAGASTSSDATFFKVGYKTGKHAIAFDSAEGENTAGEEGDSTGVTYAYFPHKGVELFAMVRTLDSTGVAGSQSVDLTSFGSRVKF